MLWTARISALGRAISSCRQPSGPLTACRPRTFPCAYQGLAKRVELSFVLNQLDYMAKSGRCSGVLAFGANILGIKPSLAVIDGELKVVRKYRGSLPICVGKYITDQLANREDIDRSMVFISSTQAKPGCMEAINGGCGSTQF